MTSDLSVFTMGPPRREWLVRCMDANLRLGVCGIEANDGEITIVAPSDEIFTFAHSDIADLHTALGAAITQAARDLESPQPKGLPTS